MTEEQKWDLPPAEHPIGVYLGLLLSTLILGVGSAVLFISIYTIFQKDGFNLTSDFVGRILLFFASAYGAISALTALYNMVSFQRRYTKKVEKEFKEFTVYARPLVEEVIRQRLVSQKISEQLDQLKKSEKISGETENGVGAARWNETLILVALLGNISVGLYLYLERYPWELVPYSLIVLAVAWWIVIARHFEFVSDSRSYYLPAIYILIIPSLSIILRAYMDLHQVLFFVYLSLIPYLLGMYAYYSHVTTGHLPSFLPDFLKERVEGVSQEKKEATSAENTASGKLKEFMPSKKKGE